MKTCHNLVCQIAVSAAYLLKEIDDEGLANHPCRDIVKSVRSKPHVNVGVIGGTSNLKTLIASCVHPIFLVGDESTNDQIEELKDATTMEIKFYPSYHMPDLPKRNDGANTFRHHGKSSYNKFGGRK